jgi:nucleoside-diphosphate-sugar epimerase
MISGTKKIKLLVTGASGFIGQEVSRQLSIGGYRPRLMIRQAGDDCDICHLDADFVLADLRDHKSLKQAVKGVDGIIHLGARATFESYETLKPSILDGSLALMKAGIAAGVRRFVYSSSLLVYSGEACYVNADTPANPILDYGRIKVDTEKQLSEIAASAGISFAALRLPHVYGSRDLYFRQLRAGRLILPGLGKNIYTHLHVADAAAAIIACAEQSFSGILPFGDRLPSTWDTFLKVARQHYPDARVHLVPQWLALLATALLIPFRRIRPNPGLETPGAVRTYNFNLAVDPDLLWKDLRLVPRYPTIYEGIPAVAAESPNLEVLKTRMHMV